ATTEAVNAFPNKSSDRQGICPDGWVIPSDYDFNQLEEEIATNPSLYSTQTTSFAWDEMYKGMTGWRPGEGNTVLTWWGRTMKSPTAVTTTVTNGVSKTDGMGFNALIVGALTGGNALYYGTNAYFWSSSTDSATVAWRRYLAASYSGATRTTNNKYYLFSVRCKK
ncbi:MAG: fibrobacter succinogenes major paralogous domain-containing protein, partial [Dysgonamonadaceae bacterium]|nr:fibrobacter succinogenes major paralogous domain-containing protein [Dysgonamonadaceae bacterium]